MSRVHRAAPPEAWILLRRTACGIYASDIMAGDMITTDPAASTCEWCNTGQGAPLCSTDPVALRMYVIYYSPRDYPGMYVVREWYVHDRARSASEPCAVAPTLEEARAKLRALPRGPGLYKLGPHPDDDPTVVEVWV